MPDERRYYQAVVYAGDGVTPLLTASSAPGADCFLIAPPGGDGMRLDPIAGTVDVGAYEVAVVDAGFAVVTPVLADAGGRPRVLSNRMAARWGTDGATYPNTLLDAFVNRLRFPNPLRAEFTIGEARRGETKRVVWDRIGGDYTATRAYVGGPVRGMPRFGTDYGGALVRVESVTAHANGPVVQLALISAWVDDTPGSNTNWRRVGPYFPTEFQLWLDARAKEYGAIDPTTYASLGIYGWFPDLEARVYTPPGGGLGGALLGRFSPLDASDLFNSGVLDGYYQSYLAGLFGTQFFRVRWVDVRYPPGDPLQPATPAVGDELALYIEPTRTTPTAPLYAYGRPAEVEASLLAGAGFAVDAASVAATTAAIGEGLTVAVRRTAGLSLGELRAQFGYFGYGVRTVGGVRVFFPTRLAHAAAPTFTLTAAHLRAPPPDVMTLEESSAVNSVAVTRQRYRTFDPATDGNTERPVDGWVGVAVEEIFDPSPGDALDYATRSVAFTLDAEVGALGVPTFFASLKNEPAVRRYERDFARELFDRFGRGAATATFDCLDSVPVQLGETMLVDLPWHPGGSARGTVRLVQVVQRSESASGPTLQVIDGGTNAQPATAPAFTVAATAGSPRHRALVSLSNAPALVTQGSRARLEVAVVAAGGAAPSGSGAPLALLDPATETTVETPNADAGRRVWVRARSEQPDRRPGAWTAWASADLAALPAPTAFTATADAGDGTRAVLAWTNGDATLGVEIRYRATATEPDLRPLAVLVAGSTRYEPYSLIPGTAYTFDVRHVEPAPYTGASTSATDTETTSGTVPTLTAPSVPIVSSNGLGTIRVDVTAASLPSVTAFEGSDESAVGSGVSSGTWAVFARRDSVTDDYTSASLSGIASTGKRVFVRVRHERAGATPSAYSPEVSVDPFSVTSGGGGSVPVVPAPTLGTVSRVTSALVEVNFTPDGAAPSGTVYTIEYAASTSGPWTDSGASDTASPIQTLAPATQYFRLRADRSGYLSNNSAATGSAV